LHVVLSGLHVPASHFPPQHSPSAAHAALSAMHCLFEHFPPTHENVQHSLFEVHVASGAPQFETDFPHWPVAVSQLLVQHSALVVHCAPSARQSTRPVPPSSSISASLPQPTNDK
jgi:hypothetical protein